MCRFFEISFFLTGLLLTSCATIKYSPEINLTPVNETINKSIKVECFIDSSSTKDRMNPFTGFSLTNKDILKGALDSTVTRVIINDLKTNNVFSQIGDKIVNPDYILRGTIKKFRAVSALSGYGMAVVGLYIAGAIVEISLSNTTVFLSYIPTTGLLAALPARKNTIDIELEISVFDKSGVLLKKYSGKNTNVKAAYLLSNNAKNVPALANKALSQVWLSLREKIINDIQSTDQKY